MAETFSERMGSRRLENAVGIFELKPAATLVLQNLVVKALLLLKGLELASDTKDHAIEREDEKRCCIRECHVNAMGQWHAGANALITTWTSMRVVAEL